MVYEVRETTNSNDPADRSRLVAFFQTYREGVPLLAADERGGALGVRGSERGLTRAGGNTAPKEQGNARHHRSRVAATRC